MISPDDQTQAAPFAGRDAERPETGSRGVVMLGMHRSGTSAATRVVNLMGVPVASQERLRHATESNPRGFWEVPELNRVNDRLLRELGGWWSSPPPATADPRSAGADLRDEARRRFWAVHRERQWLWKDPRTCLTLAFWLEALGVRPAMVLVVRDPLEAARSVAARNGFTERLGLALWERYNRAVAGSLTGRPVFVLAYRELLERPEELVAELAAFLGQQGIEVTAPAPASLHGFLTGTLRRFSNEGAPEDGPSGPQLELHDRLLAQRGARATFDLGELLPETRWVEPLFADLRWAREPLEKRARDAREQARRRERRLARLERRLTRERARAKERRRRLAAIESSPAWRALRRLGRGPR